MSNPIEESARGDVAHQVVDWLTNEVGFRKKSTLVSARGEEKITIEEIQPLLQGDLASLLQFFSQHTVSTPNATRIRQTLASYCNYLTSNDSSGSGPDALEYLKLRGDIQDKDNREKDLAAEIRGLELDNRSSMQSISDIRTKKQAIETRIRDLRMQILVRQAMSENVRRLSQRMQLLVHEMTHGISTAQKAPASADLIQAIQGLGTERSSHQGNSGTSVNGLLTRLLSQVKQPMLQNQENSASEVGKRQQIIASIIYGLKDLEDKYLQMQNRRSSLSQESKVAESNLNQQIETLASELKMHAASTAATGDETNFQNTIPLVVLLDAASSVSRSQQHGQLMVPVETSALARSNTSVDAKVSELASVIRSIRQGMADIGNAVDITSEYAQKKVAAANKQLLEALRYPDLRKAFNQVKMSQLEQFQVDPGNEKKAGPFVTHNRYSGVERSQQIAELSHMANPELEMTMVSCQQQKRKTNLFAKSFTKNICIIYVMLGITRVSCF